MEIKEKLADAIREATLLMQGGHKAKATRFVKDAYDLTLEDPFLFWNEVDQLADLGKIMLVANIFDFYDDEETNIRLAHLSYFFLSRALQLQNEIIAKAPIDQLGFEASLLLSLTKDRVMLMARCYDCFVPTLLNLLFTAERKFTAEEKVVIDKLIGNKIPTLVFYDLQNLDRYFSNFGNDPYLIEIEVDVIGERKLGTKDFVEGGKLHTLLFDYLHAKIVEDDLFF